MKLTNIQRYTAVGHRRKLLITGHLLNSGERFGSTYATPCYGFGTATGWLPARASCHSWVNATDRKPPKSCRKNEYLYIGH